MNSGRIKNSPRLQALLTVLMHAEHPISAQEIAVRAYPHSKEVMLNVSTNIGEMRSDENRQDGYIVSFSTIWRAVRPGEETGRRVNRDNSVAYIIARCEEPWHDSRPRYWLLAAPGWLPRWVINDAGMLVPAGSRMPERAPKPAPVEIDQPVLCRNPSCGRPLDPALVKTGAWCCNDDCRRQWKESMFAPAVQEQGGLL